MLFYTFMFLSVKIYTKFLKKHTINLFFIPYIFDICNYLLYIIG